MADGIKQSLLNKARKDKFLMVITPPESIREINTKSERDNKKVINDSIQYSIYGALIPKITVAEVGTQYSGQTFKFTSHHRPSYENIFVNFTIDNRFNNYWVLFKWINILNNNREAIYDAENIKPQKNFSLPITQPEIFEEYATTITIYGLDEYDNRKIQFDFLGALPVSLGQISYNYRDPMEAECTFEFAFSQFAAKLLS
tara:strand:- start:370 stop:972 length:603 start_codon:yes stop_codon:yes gene_type:complete